MVKDSKVSLWYQLYFVVATLIGLVCIVIGVSSLLNNVIITYVVPVKSVHINPPPQPAIDTKMLLESEEVTPEQKQLLVAWETEYRDWEKTQKNYDYETENRRRSLASSVALLLTGVPVFMLHAPMVFKKARS